MILYIYVIICIYANCQRLILISQNNQMCLVLYPNGLLISNCLDVSGCILMISHDADEIETFPALQLPVAFTRFVNLSSKQNDHKPIR